MALDTIFLKIVLLFTCHILRRVPENVKDLFYKVGIIFAKYQRMRENVNVDMDPDLRGNIDKHYTGHT